MKSIKLLLIAAITAFTFGHASAQIKLPPPPPHPKFPHISFKKPPPHPRLGEAPPSPFSHRRTRVVRHKRTYTHKRTRVYRHK